MRKPIQHLKAILFDLDGTLLDTALDLTASLNHIRQQKGLTELPIDEIRPYVSLGANAMVQKAFALSPEAEGFDTLKTEFLAYYAKNIARFTQYFEGMQQVIRTIEQQSLSWGIVTNKPTHLTESLLAQLNIRPSNDCVICGDTLKEKKPHPAPIEYACKLLNVSPKEACYVGDAERDIQAANSANTYSIVALFGYLFSREEAMSWAANNYIETPVDLLDFLP